MKRLTALLLLLVFLTGCSFSSASPSAEDPSAFSSVSQGTEPAQTEAAPPDPDLLDGSTPVREYSRLYRIHNAAADSIKNVSSFALLDDCLLLGGFPEPPSPRGTDEPLPYRMILVDLQTGQLRA